MNSVEVCAAIERLQWIRATLEAVEVIGQQEQANRLVNLAIYLAFDLEVGLEAGLEDLVARGDAALDHPGGDQ